MPPVVVRRTPHPERQAYGEHVEDLRVDFLFCCSYCAIAEVECSPEAFEVDHYHPQTAGGGHEYGNLHYACHSCNNRKRDWWPNEAQLAKGARIIACDVEDPGDHLELVGDRLVDKTAVGKFNRMRFDLNRPFLAKLRRARNDIHESEAVTRDGLRALARARLDELKPGTRAELAILKTRLEAEGKAIGDELEDLLRFAGSWGPGEPERADLATEQKERAAYMREMRIVGTPKEPKNPRSRLYVVK